MKRSIFALVLCLGLLTACVSKPAAQTTAPTDTPAPVETSAPTTEATPEAAPEATPEATAAPLALSPLEAIRAQVQEANTLCGVAYTGFALDLSADFSPEAVYALFPWAESAPFVDAGGDDVYLVVPASDSMTLTVRAVELSDDGKLVPTGEALYSGAGQVVLLRCNVSDIVPNTLVTAIEGDQVLEFSPSLSLRDGALAVMPGVADLTVYPEGFEFDRD